jgi:uncharacterized phiE125 gp8 family phage protein
MTNRIKTPPALEPVTLADMRTQLGIIQSSDTSRDEVIKTRIVSARRWAESYMRRALITQTWTQYNNGFDDHFDLLADLQSVTSIKYLDKYGVQQTLSSTIYYVDTVNSRVWLKTGQVWPDTYVQPNAVEIEYISGYGGVSSVPVDIIDAIKFIVGHWENYQSALEGARISTIPYAVEQLLRPYVDMRSAF